jgi:hypothetical protein
MIEAVTSEVKSVLVVAGFTDNLDLCPESKAD